MKDVMVLLKIKDEIDDGFIKKLQKQFPQIAKIKKANGNYNIHLHLKSETTKEIKEAFNEISPLLKKFQIADELIIADDW